MSLPTTQPTTLPKALQPWQTWLSWLDPELIPAFSDLLQRLSRALGPVQGKQLGGLPEQDGIGQIQRKGDYQNLLLSEWLMADEVPDEFMRRAINAEHLFLAPNYKSQQSLNQITVLFDTGISQLGECRLVHIAMLIILAQRAEKVGCTLMWGTLQSIIPLMPLNSINDLYELLTRRTYSPVLNENITHWQNVIAEDIDVQNGEIWLVTGAHQQSILKQLILKQTASSHHIELMADDCFNKTIDVKIRTPHFQRHIVLPTPPKALSSQLLKGQLRPPSVQNTHQHEHKISLMFSPVISFHGSAVGVTLLGKPGLMVIKIPPLNRLNPNSSLKKTFVYQIYPDGYTILALQCHGKKVGALLSNNNGLYFWQLPKLSYIPRPSDEEFSAGIGRGNTLTSAYLSNREYTSLFVHDRARRLVAFSSNIYAEEKNSFKIVEEKVLGIEKIADNLLVYIYLNGSSELVQMVTGADFSRNKYQHRLYFTQFISYQRAVLFAYRHKYTDGSKSVSCAISLGTNRQSWHVYNMEIDEVYGYQIDLPQGWQGIGLFYPTLDGSSEEDLTTLNILMISPNKRNIANYSKGEIEILYRADNPFTRYSFSPSKGLFAALTDHAQVVVYDVYQKQLRLNLYTIAQEGDIQNA
ncbi:hypothetical protein LW139_10195 [Proteus vulgaris]|uniref:hypothetical protein n=1 Tax=Proteus vulgaris TaxID=585 RepID=UPI001FFFB6F7|nr:hypothetical protein [Proteus vulgaris]UPK83036.1 hypothetical protein LW139_10195 [Proteus vulgaris]